MTRRAKPFVRGILLLASAFSLTLSTLQAQLVADGATNTLSNVTTNIPGNVTVGTNGSFTLLILSDNALLTNSADGVIGQNTAAKSNEVRLISSTARWWMGGSLYVGDSGVFNRLALSNGAQVASLAGVLGLSSASASNNTVVVNGAGSSWSNVNQLIVGNFSSGNRLEVSGGGQLASGRGIIGNRSTSSNNLVLVTGTNSIWRSTDDLTVGFARSGNQLVVSNGGMVWNSYGYIGEDPGGANNLALVTDAGSAWSNQAELYVGVSDKGNQLVVTNSGTVVASNLFVGLFAISTNNRVVVDGGTLRVTNAAGTGLLDIRRGTNVLNAGLVEVDQLLVTNAAGRFEFNGGTLSSRNTTVSNGQSFRIGNGVSTAAFNLVGNGTHSFGNSLTVSTNATISMEISKSGSALTNGLIQVTGALTYGGFLTVSNLGPSALAAGDRFKLFDATSYGGSFTNVTLPPLTIGLFWTNKLLLDGSIEVLGLIVQTLPAGVLIPTNATLNGLVYPGGNSATAWFEFGSTTNYGTVTAPQTLGSGLNPTNFSQVLFGLVGGVPYHFRAVATNGFGTVFGGDQSFMLPAFYDIGAGLTGIDSTHSSMPIQASGSAAWGDYDSDGRLDVLLAGNGICQIWRYTGTVWTLSSNIPSGLSACSVAWGDYDNDGRLDFVLAGDDDFISIPFTMLFRNTPGGFINVNTNASARLLGIFAGTAAWGDYDNDGLLEILLAGIGGTTNALWRNVGDGWSNINSGLPSPSNSSAAWGDYDNDGWLDVLLNGVNSPPPVWRNTGSGFTNIGAGPFTIVRGSVAWGDYDNDGRLDMLLTGTTTGTSSGAIAQVWRNTGNGFTNINADLPAVQRSAAAWGDYDNDGRLDILLTGTTNDNASGSISQIWRNTGNGFTNINLGLPGVSRSTAAWGDYDSDGRLDILITGTNPILGRISQIWRNQTPSSNTPPAAPSGLTAAIASNLVILSWNAASDVQTPASGLTYNVRIGSTPGASDVMGPMAGGNGFRRLPQMGNANERLFTLFPAKLNTPYYWSVQAIDNAFAGGPFAPEQVFTINTVFTPTNGIPVPGDQNGDGIVSQSEFAAVLTNLNGNGIVSQSDLDLVLSNYFPNSPWLYLTNVAGLGGTNVTFALTNDLAGAFSVEFSTNLVDWYFLGPATPRYLFTDTNAPAAPQRYYRLRWP